jgi:hypothetical protein
MPDPLDPSASVMLPSVALRSWVTLGATNLFKIVICLLSVCYDYLSAPFGGAIQSSRLGRRTVELAEGESDDIGTGGCVTADGIAG